MYHYIRPFAHTLTELNARPPSRPFRDRSPLTGTGSSGHHNTHTWSAPLTSQSASRSTVNRNTGKLRPRDDSFTLPGRWVPATKIRFPETAENCDVFGANSQGYGR